RDRVGARTKNLRHPQNLPAMGPDPWLATWARILDRPLVRAQRETSRWQNPRMRSVWGLLAAAGILLSVAWVLASPVGASPDEPAHISYAWGTVTGQTLAGERLGSLHEGRPMTVVWIPQKLQQYPEPGCYAFHPEKPVSWCSQNPPDSADLVVQETY